MECVEVEVVRLVTLGGYGRKDGKERLCWDGLTIISIEDKNDNDNENDNEDETIWQRFTKSGVVARW